MRRIALVIQCIAILLLLTACVGTQQPIAPATSTTSPSSTPVSAPTTQPATPTSAPGVTAQPILAPTRTPTASAQAVALAKWQSSPHANTYDLGKGPNTYCARCHSPQNWDIDSKIDAPPDCVSCKFPNDATVRIAQSNRLVSPNEWKNIGCDVCHREEHGESAEIAWLNPAAGKYESVANVTALCEKCHTDTDVLRHRRDLGATAHVGFQCTRCHDVHTTLANCASSQCHANLPKPAGHDAAHARVNCVACHDASGLSVGPDNQSKTWLTWRTTEVIGRKTTAPYISHNLHKAVDCARCHFDGNPWGLSASIRKTP